MATDASRRLPIGVCIRTIRAEPAWWLESARRLDTAGYAGLWAWDHFMGRGDKTVPVVESWTILSAASAATNAAWISRLGPEAGPSCGWTLIQKSGFPSLP